MAKLVCQFGCLLLVLLSAGCKEMFGPQGLPPDPLFSAGKPPESKARKEAPTPLPYSEPTPPINRALIVQR